MGYIVFAFFVNGRQGRVVARSRSELVKDHEVVLSPWPHCEFY